jgi:hypothetical protein
VNEDRQSSPGWPEQDAGRGDKVAVAVTHQRAENMHGICVLRGGITSVGIHPQNTQPITIASPEPGERLKVDQAVAPENGAFWLVFRMMAEALSRSCISLLHQECLLQYPAVRSTVSRKHVQQGSRLASHASICALKWYSRRLPPAARGKINRRSLLMVSPYFFRAREAWNNDRIK